MTQSDLQEGDTAPQVDLPRDGGGRARLADFAGGPVVLFFYPRDDTSGCTREALGFTEHAADFAAAGATVLGVSKDSVRKHDSFRDKHGLGIPLLSDAEGDVCERYGVWREKSMYGRTFMGIERSTFLIGADGRIARIWRRVKVPGHVEEVLAAVRAL
ncbi:AhpC/TSA family protein [Oceanicola granulosus HTCC2516]|uniref:thioredoxin-dependent peroxiredoxin n=1 Tax=Oceanicola granulosus (strain ATCC BAA-861 / DSM 15982 / KCTC 12143 / HTCC2516) TaxID=314256 RepID=Q2CD31_OCEGH|nr:peroxiredoxin [Oceanicola granulosus]EAR50545.1 AhpC/TSA family protein [Oceanicola granulosus HTCC2516]